MQQYVRQGVRIYIILSSSISIGFCISCYPSVLSVQQCARQGMCLYIILSLSITLALYISRYPPVWSVQQYARQGLRLYIILASSFTLGFYISRYPPMWSVQQYARQGEISPYISIRRYIHFLLLHSSLRRLKHRNLSLSWNGFGSTCTCIQNKSSWVQR